MILLSLKVLWILFNIFQREPLEILISAFHKVLKAAMSLHVLFLLFLLTILLNLVFLLLSFSCEVLQRTLLLRGSIFDAPTDLFVQIFDQREQFLEVGEPFHHFAIFLNGSRHGPQLGLQIALQHVLNRLLVALIVHRLQDVGQVVRLHHLRGVDHDPGAGRRCWGVQLGWLVVGRVKKAHLGERDE